MTLGYLAFCFCGKKAKFEIFDMSQDKWMPVCGTHDSDIGIHNLMASGCTNKEAKRINREVKSKNEVP